MMGKKSPLHMVAGLLTIVGALNWGLVGLGYFFGGNWNLVTLIFTTWLSLPVLENVVYLAVGASAVVCAVMCNKECEKM